MQLRSLPNGVKDEFDVTGGKVTQRIGVKTSVPSGTVINYADMATGGQFVAYDTYGQVMQTGIKGDTLTADATQLNYQLAEPVVTKIQPQILTAKAGDTIMWLPHVKEEKIYDSGLAVKDTTLPIKSLVEVTKINKETLERTDIAINTCTIAGDGLSFTSTALVDGDMVEFVYEYDQSLTTVPEIVTKYVMSRTTQADENTKGVQLNNKAINELNDFTVAYLLNLEARITLLEII